ncbi:MAG: heparan-alpha-glucosaminide N-acetyltransferase [Candidatus Aenigmarchaeota archaeon]|nr:heparan-alpha-glucosaminide N-acetyltransferase [Candidatus Aenigmarchaeota archaeon]
MHAKRLWEIDSLRGIAIILMVISNFVTDVSFFGIYSINIYSGFWLFFARLVVSMFILLAGISLTLSYSKVRNRPSREIHKKYLLRGAKIFGLGMLITLVTWIFLKQDFILFGILHLIGISIILGHLLVKNKRLSLFLGILFILIGIYLQNLAFGFPWLVWLGFKPEGFYSVDYVPIFPWFGLFLIGVFLGNLLYPEGGKRFGIRDFSNSRVIIPLRFLGRNSLLIYFIHQPILILFLWFFFPFPYHFFF